MSEQISARSAWSSHPRPSQQPYDLKIFDLVDLRSQFILITLSTSTMQFAMQIIHIMQIVQIGVQAMHGGASPMQVTTEQLAALQASVAELPARDMQPRPMEYQQYGKHEPWYTIMKLIGQLQDLTPGEVAEGVNLVEQVSLPRTS